MNFCLIAGTPSSHLRLDALIKGTVTKKTQYKSLITSVVPRSPLLGFELIAFALAQIFNHWSTAAIKRCSSYVIITCYHITVSNCGFILWDIYNPSVISDGNLWWMSDEEEEENQLSSWICAKRVIWWRKKEKKKMMHLLTEPEPQMEILTSMK